MEGLGLRVEGLRGYQPPDRRERHRDRRSPRVRGERERDRVPRPVHPAGGDRDPSAFLYDHVHRGREREGRRVLREEDTHPIGGFHYSYFRDRPGECVRPSRGREALEFRARSLGFGVQGLGFRVQG